VQNCFNILPRQALHAQTLGFIHPTTRTYMEFEAPLPADFDEALNKWRNYIVQAPE
jgi:23S rRNA pseudouridine1911/1915/1917 synthase